MDAERRQSRDERRAQANLDNALHKIDELQREAGVLKRARNAADKRAADAEAEQRLAEGKLEEYEAQRQKQARKIKSERTFSRRSALIANELARHTAADLPRLLKEAGRGTPTLIHG